jgi:murein DD-endopeptidase MepM/ murein hydrolase activator NlpD
MPFFMPCLPAARFSVQPGMGFLAPGYEQATGALHPGADYNIKPDFWDARGPNTDLGLPIHAVTDGRVLAARFYPVWGNIVLLEHAPGIWTMSAHCNDVRVKAGDRVIAGQEIGTIGRGAPDKNHPNGRYFAHLHFEVRRFGPDRIAPNDWPSARLARAAALKEIQTKRLDPEVWLAQVGALPNAPID